MTLPTLNIPLDPPVQAELVRLYHNTLTTDAEIRRNVTAQGIDEHHPEFYHHMQQAYMPVTPDFGTLLHILVKSMRPQTVIEFGTSFGISTLFLAAGLRAHGGRLITTEFEPHKAAQARQSLIRAGLNDLVEIRIGDALQTLADGLPDTVDLVFLDGAKPLYLDILLQLRPRLRAGTLIVSDNADMAGAAPYLDYLAHRDHGFINTAVFSSALGDYYRHDVALYCGAD